MQTHKNCIPRTADIKKKEERKKIFQQNFSNINSSEKKNSLIECLISIIFWCRLNELIKSEVDE